ncbi:AbfB domain-containing protein, partial [Streptomyces purpurascens]
SPHLDLHRPRSPRVQRDIHTLGDTPPLPAGARRRCAPGLIGRPEQRDDATFRRVSGLADSSCYSFTTADGRYLRHRSFVLVEDGDDGSALFRKDATFCPRPVYPSGAVMLESVNYPGRFLRHRDFQLRLDPYQHYGQFRADASFRLVAGLD